MSLSAIDTQKQAHKQKTIYLNAQSKRIFTYLATTTYLSLAALFDLLPFDTK